MQDGRRERIAEGREAEVFAWEPGTVLKLYRESSDASTAAREADATAAVFAAGGPAPRCHGLTTVDGRPGVVLDRVDGQDLVTVMGRRPWVVPSAGTAMGRAHAALHAVSAPTSLPATRALLERRIRDPGVPPAWRERGLHALERLPDGGRLCHNDLHPQNVILTARGVVVIDWPAATRGDPAADVARSLVILTVGEPPPSAPLRVRVLGRPAAAVFRRRYLTAYRATSPLDARAQEWLLPVAVARAAEGIAGEHERLGRLIHTLTATSGS